MSAKLDTEIAHAVISDKGRAILAWLRDMRIDREQIDELAREFAKDERRALAMARDLGWAPEVFTPERKGGLADESGKYNPEAFRRRDVRERARAASRKARTSRR